MKHYDYCPHCRKRTECIKAINELICKSCGKKSKITLKTLPQEKLQKRFSRWARRTL